jgi:hypothetical protein
MDIRGVYRFSSLMKQKIKGKNYAVFCFAGKKILLFYIYDVIVKQFFYKRSTNHYSCPPLSPSPHANSFLIGCTAVINTHKSRKCDETFADVDFDAFGNELQNDDRVDDERYMKPTEDTTEFDTTPLKPTYSKYPTI